jgi:hypothetical protein
VNIRECEPKVIRQVPPRGFRLTTFPLTVPGTPRVDQQANIHPQPTAVFRLLKKNHP